ncbi:hypothetical protein BKA70DRAFT_1129402 [Coprinopsis sp. MPI-PUGE-AT-0042]|nr:hypothetical protein BKA70DRAFT_1129402 [Coprinopsis sp. MPI-PUGE-AT-0042]
MLCKLRKRPRPKNTCIRRRERHQQAAPRSRRCVAQCFSYRTAVVPFWRKDDEGKTTCNACGLYHRLHGSARPISVK